MLCTLELVKTNTKGTNSLEFNKKIKLYILQCFKYCTFCILKQAIVTFLLESLLLYQYVPCFRVCSKKICQNTLEQQKKGKEVGLLLNAKSFFPSSFEHVDHKKSTQKKKICGIFGLDKWLSMVKIQNIQKKREQISLQCSRIFLEDLEWKILWNLL